MKTFMNVKRKLFGGYKVYFEIDCSCKCEAESIELSIMQMLGHIKAYDFDNPHTEEDGEEENEEQEPKFGFANFMSEEGVVESHIEGYDDGLDPEEDYYEDEEDE